MKKICKLFLAAAAVLTLCGCASPYDYGKNWLIRENDVPQFYSKFDLFYIGEAPTGYGDSHDIQFNWTKTHTNDIFGHGVRVFSPDIPSPNEDNVAEALQYFMRNFHKSGHPFVLLAEGKSADLLYQAMKRTSGMTVRNGFVAAYLPDMTPKTAEEISSDFYFQGLKAASNAHEPGVIVTWISCINGEKINENISKPENVNINPLNWKTDSTPGTAAENVNAVFYMPESKNLLWRKVEARNFCGAVINRKRGVLEINCRPELLHQIKGKYSKNSISIFAGNIVMNANLRKTTLIRSREW